MNLRRTIAGTVAALILTAPPSFAMAQESGGFLGRIGLPGVFGGESRNRDAPTATPVQMAQAGDPRVTALEEQIRQLSGTLEELNFQILQMQEQLRKMQEDNEFRFQELEKRGDATGKTNRTVAGAPEKKTQAGGAPPGKTASTLPGGVIDGTKPADGVGDVIKQSEGKLGTITVDRDGSVRTSGSSIETLGGEPMDDVSDGTTVASLPAAGGPDELYRNSYEFILSGDYPTAESGFRDYVEKYPTEVRTADAHFWLGESLLGQGKYRDAAEVFLAANKNYPDSKKAPDMLFKLGVSLAGLKQRDVACATFTEVAKRYPNSSTSLKDRVKQERAALSC